MNRDREATDLLQSELLDELVEDYVANQFERWLDARETHEQHQIRAKANAARDFHMFVNTRCREIVTNG